MRQRWTGEERGTGRFGEVGYTDVSVKTGDSGDYVSAVNLTEFREI